MALDTSANRTHSVSLWHGTNASPSTYIERTRLPLVAVGTQRAAVQMPRRVRAGATNWTHCAAPTV